MLRTTRDIDFLRTSESAKYGLVENCKGSAGYRLVVGNEAGFIIGFYRHKAARVVEADKDIHDLQKKEEARVTRRSRIA